MIPLISELVKLLSDYPLTSTFFSGFLTEELLIIITFISGRGEIPFYIILTIGTLGIIVSDIILFLFVKIKPLHKLTKRLSNARKRATSKTRIDSLPPPTRLRSFIFLKFFYGIRTWAIFYNSVHKTSLKKFIKMTTIATLIYVSIMATLAKILGSGIYIFFDTTKDIGKTFLLLLALIAIVVTIYSAIYKRLKTSNKK